MSKLDNSKGRSATTFASQPEPSKADAKKTEAKKDSHRGASLQKHGLISRLKGWGNAHGQAAFSSLGDLWRHPVSALMTLLVLGVALSLPGAFHLLLKNTGAATTDWQQSAKISIYLKSYVSDNAAEKLSLKLASRPDIFSAEFTSAQQSLESFKQESGLADALAILDHNPLPGLITIQPANTSNLAAAEKLKSDLALLNPVDRIQLDQQWLMRLNSIIEVARRSGLVLGVLLSLAVLLVIGNTIRLLIMNRREEIEIIKLIGASDAFLRRPFLYSGIWYGLGGAIIAWLAVHISLLWLDGPAAALASLYASSFSLQGLNFAETVKLLLTGGGLGLIGAWLAVRRHLKEIQPS
ncbi:permease-like cell division protein FtsX [Pelagibaculum spongiae]|uniref:Cell division protein FtsX n=1 Tax=Pelagibaculum spongiae TaxID=2080658 RepID=A0A2V1H2L6_9GAMM|nr:permease-like cell division protein FtsX [Pelagibaculum spongiae]PVZ70641.1 cell division protein FtsX [Pelagibaculum spongiae]